jgi:hypothetical protein
MPVRVSKPSFFLAFLDSRLTLHPVRSLFLANVTHVSWPILSNFSYAINLINCINLNFAINSVLHFQVDYPFEGLRDVNSYHFYYSVFITSYYSRSRHFIIVFVTSYSCSSHVYHSPCHPTLLLLPRLHIHVPAMFIIVQLSLRSHVRSHVWYH